MRPVPWGDGGWHPQIGGRVASQNRHTWRIEISYYTIRSIAVYYTLQILVHHSCIFTNVDVNSVLDESPTSVATHISIYHVRFISELSSQKDKWEIYFMQMT